MTTQIRETFHTPSRQYASRMTFALCLSTPAWPCRWCRVAPDQHGDCLCDWDRLPDTQPGATVA